MNVSPITSSNLPASLDGLVVAAACAASVALAEVSDAMELVGVALGTLSALSSPHFVHEELPGFLMLH